MKLSLMQQLDNSIRQIIRDEFKLLINEQIHKTNNKNQINLSEGYTETVISSKIGWLKKTSLKHYNFLIFYGFHIYNFINTNL